MQLLHVMDVDLTMMRHTCSSVHLNQRKKDTSASFSSGPVCVYSIQYFQQFCALSLYMCVCVLQIQHDDAPVHRVRSIKNFFFPVSHLLQ